MIIVDAPYNVYDSPEDRPGLMSRTSEAMPYPAIVQTAFGTNLEWEAMAVSDAVTIVSPTGVVTTGVITACQIDLTDATVTRLGMFQITLDPNQQAVEHGSYVSKTVVLG